MNMMTTLRGTAATGRGLLSVRAEAQPKKPVSVETIAALFEEFKAAHTQQLAGKADAVVDEKVERINGALTEMQAQFDEINRTVAAATSRATRNTAPSSRRILRRAM